MTSLVLSLNGLGAYLVDALQWLSLEWTLWAALIFWLAYLFLGRSPVLRHLAWVMVLIKPLTTALIDAPVSLSSFFHSVAAGIYLMWNGPARVPAPLGDFAPPALPSDPLPAGLAQPDPALDLYGLLAVAWIAGALALLLRLVAGYTYVRYLRRGADVVDCGPAHQALQDAAAALGVRRRVGLGLSAAVPSPLLTGVLRPIIILPRHLPRVLSADQLRLVFAHELAHVRRGDNLVLLVQRLVELALFFHPVAWLCGYHLRREAERACDDAVLLRYPDRARYADSLARVAELRTGRVPHLLISAFAAVESQLGHRVRRILAAPAAQRRLRASAFSVGLLAVSGCVGLPGFLTGAKDPGPAFSLNPPDPFFADSEIAFSLAEEQRVSLEIFDARGARVRTLVDDTMRAGAYSLRWDQTDDSNNPVPQGLYFLRIEAKDFRQVHKMGLAAHNGGQATSSSVSWSDSTAPFSGTTHVSFKPGQIPAGGFAPDDTIKVAFATDQQPVVYRNIAVSPEGAPARGDTLMMGIDLGDTLRSDFYSFTIDQPPGAAREGRFAGALAVSSDSLGHERQHMTLTFVPTDPVQAATVRYDQLPTSGPGPWVGQVVAAADSSGQTLTLNALTPGADRTVIRIDEAVSNTTNFTDLSISYAVPQKDTVELLVISAAGAQVRTLVSATLASGAKNYQQPGVYNLTWDATDDAGAKVPPGVYFYRLSIGGEFKAVSKRLVK